jgi:hypothetical protein
MEENEVKGQDEQWRLDKIEIEFKKGQSYEKDPQKQMDRYEGRIRFENGEYEYFQFRVSPDMANKYISLIAEDIVLAASGLGERVKLSIGKLTQK